MAVFEVRVIFQEINWQKRLLNILFEMAKAKFMIFSFYLFLQYLETIGKILN